MNLNTRQKRYVSVPPSLLPITFLLGLALLLLALALTGSARTARAQGGELRNQPRRGLIYTGLKRSTRPRCRPGFDVQIPGSKRLLCTHGPDPSPRGTTVFKSVSPLANASATAQIACDADGQSGKRVQVLYAHASDKPDRYAAYLTSIQQWAVGVDSIFSASALQTGGDRHVRFVHDAACQPIVPNVVLPPDADDTIGAMYQALQAQGFGRSDRNYLVFMDANIYCGIATMETNDSPWSTSSLNSGPYYARIDAGCWNDPTAAHELMHTFGGVQASAPHSTGAGHCFDESDRMCYSDTSKIAMQYPCESPNEFRFDCNHDDYFSTAPPPGSYLATHWNAANSAFLIGAVPLNPQMQIDSVTTGELSKKGLFTPTNVFKRGDTVTVRLHVSAQDPGNLGVVQVDLRALQPDGSAICVMTLLTDAKSSAQGSCDLPRKAPAGQWRIAFRLQPKANYVLDPASLNTYPFTVTTK